MSSENRKHADVHVQNVKKRKKVQSKYYKVQ